MAKAKANQRKDFAKDAEFKPMKLHFDAGKEKAFNEKLDAKLEAFVDLQNLIEEHVEITDRVKLYEAPLETFNELLIASAEGEFKTLSFEKLAFLKDIDLSLFREVELRLKGIDLEIDPMTMKAVHTPDFWLYTQSINENKQLIAYNQIANGLNLHHSINPQPMQQVMNNISFDYGTNTYQTKGINLVYSRRVRRN